MPEGLCMQCVLSYEVLILLKLFSDPYFTEKQVQPPPFHQFCNRKE